MVDGRRVKREGRFCPRVDIALEVSLVRGRKSFELARRGRLADRGTGEDDCGGGVEEGSAIAADSCTRLDRRRDVVPRSFVFYPA